MKIHAYMAFRRVIVAAVLVTAVLLQVSAEEPEPLGRDVARDGAVAAVSGNLAYRHDEWYLDSSTEQYELHMGAYGHVVDLPFRNGAHADVTGFTLPGHIAPITVATEGETYSFWHEERYPLWAGTGNRQNVVEERTATRFGSDRELGRGFGFARPEEDARLFRNRSDQPGAGR
jgi:hypothetical protein